MKMLKNLPPLWPPPPPSYALEGKLYDKKGYQFPSRRVVGHFVPSSDSFPGCFVALSAVPSLSSGLPSSILFSFSENGFYASSELAS